MEQGKATVSHFLHHQSQTVWHQIGLVPHICAGRFVKRRYTVEFSLGQASD